MIFNNVSLDSNYLIYLAAAVLPALILLIAVYRRDRVEKEPAGLLIKLIIMGVLAALISVVLETAGESLLDLSVTPGTGIYHLIMAFGVVALAEEGSKYVLMRLNTWNHPAFNYRFDGIIYAVFVSLGFAAFENIGYVFSYGLETAALRAVLSIPGHLSFAVFMGFYYGRAKYYHNRKQKIRGFFASVMSLLTAVLFHGTYDACLMLNTDESTAFFLVFVTVTFLIVFFLLRRESKKDRAL